MSDDFTNRKIDFGNTIIEAFILGTPVVATDVGGVSDLVVSGENGWLVDNNQNSITKMLKYIMDNPDEVDKMKVKVKTYSYDSRIHGIS